MDAVSIELLILDVDGVLTDGTVSTAPGGSVSKAFSVQDGAAIRRWQQNGGKIALLSGRADGAVTSRARELGIKWVHMGETDKLAAYQTIVKTAGCHDAVVGYVGDDLPDLPPMSRCGLPVAVANAVPAVKRVAGYVTRREGGRGAIAEIVELLLQKRKHRPSIPPGPRRH